MTTAAECAAVAGAVTFHGKFAQNANANGGTDGTVLAQAGQVLAGLGAGLPASSAPTDICKSHQNAVAGAVQRAVANGNFVMAAQLRTAQQIFTNLAAGL